MGSFLLISLLALLLALASVLVPLWKTKETNSALLLGLGCIIIIPIAFVVLYVLIGNPQAIEREPSASDELRAQLIAVAGELERNPDNQQGWFALGMAYKNIEAFSSAEHALRRALYLDDTNTIIQVELAETLLFSSQGQTPKEAIELLKSILVSEPMNQKSLWLLGVIAYRDEEFAEAIGHWERLLGGLDSTASIRSTIEQQIETARRQLNEVDVGTAILVDVTIDNTYANQLSGQETVFIVAQDFNGAPTPLAVQRLTVSDLPAQITMSDADAMIEGFNLSSATEIIITARISFSGNPSPQAGDLQGQVVLSDSTTAELMIDQRLE